MILKTSFQGAPTSFRVGRATAAIPSIRVALFACVYILIMRESQHRRDMCLEFSYFPLTWQPKKKKGKKGIKKSIDIGDVYNRKRLFICLDIVTQVYIIDVKRR
jgi:hypothetical protein